MIGFITIFIPNLFNSDLNTYDAEENTSYTSYTKKTCQRCGSVTCKATVYVSVYVYRIFKQD